MKIMTWSKYCLLLVSLALSGCGGLNQPLPFVRTAADLPLSKFILGKWEGNKQTVQSDGVDYPRYQLEFIDDHTFHFTQVTPGNGYDDDFTYQFVSPNTIRVQGRRDTGGRVWQITRVDESLELCLPTNSCVTLTRKWLEWGWVAGALAALLLASYLANRLFRRMSQLNTGEILE